MRLTAEVVAGFSNSCLRKAFDGPVETPSFHVEWWRLVCGKHKFVAIAAPRRHAKSTAVTHAYTLAAVLFRERSYVLVVSDTFSQACQFLGDIKRELTGNEDIQELFELGDVIKDTEDDFIIECKDGHQFRLQARGSGQNLRGLKWSNKRPDLIVCDDMENDELVQNQERRTKLKRWFYGSLIPCLSQDGVIRIVGTILHLDSLLESLMPENLLGPSRQKQLIKEELREYTEATASWKSIKYRAHNNDYSKILWSDKWSAQSLRDLREDYVRQGLPDVYSQEMLNIPIDEARSFFKRNDFHGMTEMDKKKKVNYYITCDLAITGKQRSDWTVFTVGGMDEDGILHIKNVVRDRLDGMEIVETILSLNNIYKPIMFGIEDGQISKSLMPYLNEAMLRRNEIVPLRLMKTSQDKVTRANSIQARMRAGGVKFDKAADWYMTFEDELMRFPRDKHDDQVDSFAHLGHMVDRMIDAPTAEEEAEEEYDEFLKENDYYEGRCATTGY
jgi:predicted phage terminase large subunit-like protein